MSLRVSLAGLLLACAAMGAEFRGKLHPDVEPGTRVLAAVVPATADIIAALPTAPADSDKVWMLKRPFEIKGRRFLVAVVASPTGEKVLWLDRNGDGKFTSDEKWPLSGAKLEADLSLPWDNGIYKTFPVHFECSSRPLPHAGEETVAAPTPPPELVTALVYNFNIEYVGSVAIDGHAMEVRFFPLPAVAQIDPATIRTQMDVNFNGELDRDLGEMDTGRGRAPVFHSGSRYLAVKSVDLVSGEIVVEERPPSEYTRFDATPGQEMPDFAFVDLAGVRHQLSEYRGKSVLLDFWGTWCGPCIEEMQHMAPLYQRYHALGFEIIGMDMERTAGKLKAPEYIAVNEKVKAFIAKKGYPWVQATQESIERVALDIIHVNSYPTCILIGPDGKILSRDARGEALETLLAQHVP